MGSKSSKWTNEIILDVRGTKVANKHGRQGLQAEWVLVWLWNCELKKDS